MYYTPLFPLHLTYIYFLFFNVQHLLQNGTHLRNFLKNYFTIWIDLCSFGCMYISLECQVLGVRSLLMLPPD